jgi:ribosomal protein S27E
VVATQAETARARSITFTVPHWIGHRPGQHVAVRLTAEDGYRAERSYAIVSPPQEAPRVTLTIERRDDGEVSPSLIEELRGGDQLELRGRRTNPSQDRTIQTNRRSMMEMKLDRNAAGGMLQMTLPFDTALVQATCAGCGATNAFGAVAAYMHGMGTVVRCQSCDTVLIRMAQVRGHYLLDMPGIRILEIGAES